MSDLWLFSALSWLFLFGLFGGFGIALFEWITYRRLTPRARVDYEFGTLPQSLVAASLVGLVTIGYFSNAIFGV